MRSKILIFVLCAIASGLWAQGITGNSSLNGSDGQIPLKRVVILTSGLTYYEHSGSVNGQIGIGLPFRLDAVNDALKSLVINDPSSANPSITYQSEQTLIQTLRSLKIDLSDEPGMAVILSRLKGAEVEIAAPTPVTGRIVGVEYRPVASSYIMSNEPWLLLNTTGGMRLFNLKEISSISFRDPEIEQDLNRALDLIEASRNSFSRQLLVNLPGTGRRDVSISYVIPSPVWKVSYRLDLGAQRPLFQGWAIVDNDSDNDWNNVELSLVAGRPSSFIQNLYPPYYVSRPVLPLSIAGTAEAAAYDRGYSTASSAEKEEMDGRARMDMYLAMEAPQAARAPSPSPSANLTGGVVDTASGSEAGGQFEFTIRNPVSLDRRMSAMLPLVESQIDARKLLIYSGSGRHPRLGAEITNTSGMKLPAGPITVYDGGVYAGDALIEFWNEDEKRLISFGDDLSVTASTSDTNTRTVSSVNVSGGVMTINRSLTYIKTYTFVNSGSVSKSMIVEHNKISQTNLVSPAAAEQTVSAYRFDVTLTANSETVLTVSEQRPISESIMLLSLRPETFLSYTTNQEIPPRVREALQQAVELRRAADAADAAVRDIEVQRSRLISDQDRIRRNLEAAGSQTQQGQEYLRRLVSLDGEIDAIAPVLERANAEAKAAQEAYVNYLNTLNL
ncbi:MAG: DUF4139 domain-containing protein [Treponema sp.]|jgi:hypothetical protein|nr:DUF4139 domain-containing protein [Treponema sp.]